MVKRRKKGITKKATGKGFKEGSQEARKIGGFHDLWDSQRPHFVQNSGHNFTPCGNL